MISWIFEISSVEFSLHHVIIWILPGKDLFFRFWNFFTAVLSTLAYRGVFYSIYFHFSFKYVATISVLFFVFQLILINLLTDKENIIYLTFWTFQKKIQWHFKFKSFQVKENNWSGRIFTQEQRHQQSASMKKYWEEKVENRRSNAGITTLRFYENVLWVLTCIRTSWLSV